MPGTLPMSHGENLYLRIIIIIIIVVVVVVVVVVDVLN